jgi:hypothetical protein
MNQLEVDDHVQMPGIPFVVVVLELGTCTDPNCDRPTFRFADPETGEDDWMHQDQFRVIR